MSAVVGALAVSAALLGAIAPAQAGIYARPVFVTPASDAVVSGQVRVTVTSGAPYVRFDLSSSSRSRTFVPVVRGRATVSFGTLGLDGRTRVFAASCGTSRGDCGETALLYVRVENPAPTIVAPAPGEVLYPTDDVVVRVQLEAGSVRLQAGGLVSEPVDTEAPFRFVLDKGLLPQGSRSITAFACNPAGTQCAGAEDEITVTVHRPAMDVWPESVSVSPNADGIDDSKPVKFVFQERSSLALQVRQNGTVLRTLQLGEFGTRDSHQVQVPEDLGGLPEGLYSLRFIASLVENPDVVETQTANLSVDLTPPSVEDRQLTYRTIYPHRDGYQDGTRARVRVNEPLRDIAVEVRNKAGDLVRRLSPFRVSDAQVFTYAAAWGGLAGGTRVPEGEYLIRWIFEDAVGNASSITQPLVVDDGQLVRRKVTLDVKASEAINYEIGRCSAVRKDPRWSGGRLLLSDEKCDSSPYENRRHIVVAYYSVKLPMSLMPQRARVTMVGGGVRARSHLGTIFWDAQRRKWSDVEWSGPNVERYRLLRAGTNKVDRMRWRGQLVWASFVNRGMQYRIRDYRVETTRAFLVEPAQPAPATRAS